MAVHWPVAIDESIPDHMRSGSPKQKNAACTPQHWSASDQSQSWSSRRAHSSAFEFGIGLDSLGNIQRPVLHSPCRFSLFSFGNSAARSSESVYPLLKLWWPAELFGTSRSHWWGPSPLRRLSKMFRMCKCGSSCRIQEESLVSSCFFALSRSTDWRKWPNWWMTSPKHKGKEATHKNQKVSFFFGWTCKKETDSKWGDKEMRRGVTFFVLWSTKNKEKRKR